jgi:hypothetical protein|tara:strand:+ start:260 stop:535 length:276 start_codon:yes stop_codon:yes gene_type:complete
MCGDEETRLGAFNDACTVGGSANSKKKGMMQNRRSERLIFPAPFFEDTFSFLLPLSVSLSLGVWETGEEKVKINLKIKNTPHNNNFDHSTL